MGKPRTIIAATLSTMFIVGLLAGGYEELIYSEPQRQSSQSQEENQDYLFSGEQAKSNFVELTPESIQIEEESRFDLDTFLITGEGGSKLVLDYYGKVFTNSAGDLPAYDEVFHAFHLSYDSNNITHSTPTTLSVSVDGKTYHPDLSWDETISNTITVSAAEDAEILLNIQTEEIKQSINVKTGERVSKGIADVWYNPYDSVITPEKIFKPMGETANIDMRLSFAWKKLYDMEAGWADGGKQAWVQVQTHGNHLQAGNYTIQNEVNKAWLTDEKGTRYELKTSRDMYNGTQLVFLIPADAKTLTLHTVHGGTVMNGAEIVEVIPETEIGEIIISFD